MEAELKSIKSGNSFIDENHSSLVEHIGELESCLSGEWNAASYVMGLKKFVLDIENHFPHEETILRGTKFEKIDLHTLSHRNIGLKLHKVINKKIDSQSEAEKALSNIKVFLVEHKLYEDQDYWYVFDIYQIGEHSLIRFSEDMLTGIKEIDNEHFALLNHANRFLLKNIGKGDIGAICENLKLLALYSEYHFQQEETALGGNLKMSHKANHQKLLSDLKILINELELGKFRTENLGEYLNFWFHNHIAQYDVPAFKKN